MGTIITTDDRFEALRKQYYMSDNVLFSIIDCIKFRECAFIRLETAQRKPVTIRCVKANATHYLRKNFERFDFLTNPFNLYSSLAKFPNMPMFSFNPKIRRDQQDQFNDTFIDYMQSYDFLFDIDNDDLQVAYATAYKVKSIFDAEKIPYSLTFSGNKGWHIRVEYEDFSPELQALPKDELCWTLKRFAENFRSINALPSIDLSIFDLRRIAKTPYSVVYPNYLIALPLSDEDMDNFSLQQCSIVHWLKPENMAKLFRRGKMKRDGKPEAFGNMVERYLKI